MNPTRREFLESTLGGSAAIAGAGALAFLSQLPRVSAAEANLPTASIDPESGIAPTLKLLEETPRERLLEEVAHRVKNGLSYRELLAALLVAGVRNVQPRPSVGFKFHAVLVINSAHLASLASPDSDRWLPIFWSLDRFKSAQIETRKSSGWRMEKLDESKLPPLAKARDAFVRAMDEWDEAGADLAAAALARTASRDECFELFARYGCRDFRDIGHKAIYVSNSFRTLDAIGWQHAQPVLRSLAYALQKHEQQNPAKSDLPPDRPGRRNAELLPKIRRDWQDGKPSTSATADLLGTFRAASDQEAAEAVVKALNDGVSVDAIWDAMLSASGELLMRKTNILTLHSVTTSNALHYAFNRVADPQTRLMLLLQNASFLPLFRSAAEGRGKLDGAKVDELKPIEPKAEGEGAVAEIFADAGHDRPTAARKTLAYLQRSKDARSLITAARRLVFLKGNDAHDYKFSSAVLEDYYHLSPGVRDAYLATSLFYLPSSAAPDNALVGRTRAAMSA